MTQYESWPLGTTGWWVTRVRVEWRSRYKYQAKRLDRRHAPRPLFSSWLKSKHHGFHRDPLIKTLPSGRWLLSLGPALWYPLRVFTSLSPRLGFLVVVLVAPLVRGRFVSPLPRISRRASLSDLHGRRVCSLRSQSALWFSDTSAK